MYKYLVLLVMFVINKSASNDIILTLTEKSLLVNPTYLFEFENEQYHTFTYCIGTDLSTELQRYNEFTIIEQTTPNPLLGQINLIEGNYKYNIYEQVSTTNLNPTGLTVVETGYTKCINTTTYVPTYYTGATLTNTAYEG